MDKHPAWRLRILHVFLLILIVISVLPLSFYGIKMMQSNQDTLKTQELVLQTITSQSLAQEIGLYMDNTNQRLKEFFESVQTLVAKIQGSKFESDPALRAALENFATDQPQVIFVTAVNTDTKGPLAGSYNAAADVFLAKLLERAFIAVRQNNIFDSNATTITRQGKNESVLVFARPLTVNGQFAGMVAAVVTLRHLQDRLEDTWQTAGGMEAYVVDNSAHLIASYDPNKYPANSDMASVPVVQKFLTWRGGALASETLPFTLQEGNQSVRMLGTYSSIQTLGWGVIVQKKLSEAYYSVNQMIRQTMWWGLLAIVLSLIVGLVSAKSITRPIDQLTRTARSIAQRDFSQRADVRSRTEIGELAATFNTMAEDIQHYIGELETASEQNRQLFMNSIEALASAVDAKDPYTKGHSSRVAQYSVILAKEIGLEEEDVNKIRISATLHDVGKIGVDDRVLKKPGVLTNEEFEIMKRHTVMGYEIVRQVKALEEMLPGIRWHHEQLNGKGYPDGITGDEIPLHVRIISVADTFDAITTDRPYQAGREFPGALEILRKHAGVKYDPIVVDAMHSAYAKGDLRKAEVRRSAVISVSQPAAS
jgi:putative nucleotidyltransferase with HDIG domain